MPEHPNPKLRPSVPAPLSEYPAERVICAQPYAELDITSNFSFLRGASHPDELVYRAAELGHAAVAVTDLNTLAGVVRAHQAAKQASIPLCVGSRLAFTDAPDVLVWAQNRAGYANLCRLLTRGKRRAPKGECHLALADLLESCDGLLAALVPQRIDPAAGDADQARLFTIAAELRDALGDRLSLAISRMYGPADALIQRRLESLGWRLDIPLLATNQVHYHAEHRRMLQDVLTCTRHGCTIQQAGFRLFPNGERFLKSPQQMHALFADLPQALRRSVEIAQRCVFSLEELRYEYPSELVPPGQTPIQYLTHLTRTGAAQRYPAGVPAKVLQQIEHELRLIEQLRIEPYFLTVYDLVRFARSRDILCQGRGSAANSAVCFCLGVTAVDPVRVDLLFERFVSAARNEPPDIDIDFEHERREEVIQYLYDTYGRERAAMTAEVITYRGRSAVRDVGKAMGLGLDAVDHLASRLDWWHKGSLTDEQIRETGFDPADPTIRMIVGLTGELLGFPRHLSQHVGGMVMSRPPICDMVPIENASMPDRTVIEWDKDDIDALGILKVDILALGMLTCLAKALKLINTEFEQDLHRRTPQHIHRRAHFSGHAPAPAPTPPIELHSIPPEDPSVYEMISNADTVGVFQIESRAQMSMLPRLRPKTFYDLVIEVAIVRPGPIQGDMVHPYLRRRNGEEPVHFPKPELREVLGKTMGVPLFQEQAMKLAMVAAGFTAEEADELRRAMAAWKRHGGLERFEKKIIAGMLANGYEEEFAHRCFAQIRGFGMYGFPESHAASFALLVYSSAWIKRYHPAAFAAALLNSQPMGFYAPAQIVRDAIDHGVPVLPIDVNASAWDNTLEYPPNPDTSPSPHLAATRSVAGAASIDSIPARRLASRLNAENTTPSASNDPPLAATRSVAEVTSTIPVSPRCDASPLKGERNGEGPRDWGAGGPALRLGFRQIKGMRELHAHRIASARMAGPFESVDDFHARTGLSVQAITRLAEADAFGSLPANRRTALWKTLALPDERLPFIATPPQAANEAQPLLPFMPLREEVLADYQVTGLSLKTHPLALVRTELTGRGVITAAQLAQHSAGRWVKVAGLVLIRQRPGTASGIVFETLEDETGIVNLIIRPVVYERYRSAARHAGLVEAHGCVERQGQVIHVMVGRMIDISAALAGFQLRSRDFH
jgi:error-prone DNA polymerase